MKYLHIVPGANDVANGMARVARLLAKEQGDAEVVDLSAVSGQSLAVSEGSESLGFVESLEEVWVHGMWLPKEWAICRRVIKAGKRLVRMTHGSLSPVYLKLQGRWKKWFVGPIERYWLRKADRIVATCDAEKAWIEAYLGKKCPEIVVEDVKRFFKLGVRVSAPCGCSQPIGTRASRATARPSQELGVSNWVVELVYTLNGEFEREYEAKVKARILELGMSYQDTDGSIHKPEIEKSSNSDAHLHLSSSPHFIFTGPLNDDAKWDAYERADLFVLPTYSENFGIVVAEALWAGVPVITTKGTPWSELEEYKCGKWIDLPAEGSNPSTWEALDEALVSVMAISDAERGEMGKRGRKLVEEKYTWDAVCSAMVSGYECLLKAEYSE